MMLIWTDFLFKSYKLVALRLMKPAQSLLEQHYEDLKTKSFFAGLMKYMTSGPVCGMVWEVRAIVFFMSSGC